MTGKPSVTPGEPPAEHQGCRAHPYQLSPRHHPALGSTEPLSLLSGPRAGRLDGVRLFMQMNKHQRHQPDSHAEVLSTRSSCLSTTTPVHVAG